MLIGTLTRGGLLINRSDLTARLGGSAEYTKFLNAHTVKENVVPGKFNMFAVKALKPYQVDIDSILFPRRFISIFNNSKVNTIQQIDVIPCPVDRIPEYTPSIMFTNYQQVGIQHVSEILPVKHAAYIKLGTGLGKTILGLGLIMRMGVRTIVIAPTKAIAQTWIDDGLITCPQLRVVLYKPNAAEHDVMVIIINSFYKHTIPFLDGYGMVIIDEAHEYHSPTRIDALWLAQAVPYLVGLSATPDSASHGLDKIVYKFLGAPIDILELPGCQVPDVFFKVGIKAIKYKGDPKYSDRILTSGGTMSTMLTIGNMVRDASRMKLVVHEILRLRAAGHGVMVFAELRSYVAEIAKALAEYEPVLVDDGTTSDSASSASSASSVSILQGGTSAEQLANTKKAGAHIVLTTYGYSRRGVSLVEMTALVLATPRKSNTIQIIGRILRRGSDMTKVREIVDIVDMNSGFQTQFTERKKIYDIQRYPVNIESKKFSDPDIYTDMTVKIDLEELLELARE